METGEQMTLVGKKYYLIDRVKTWDTIPKEIVVEAEIIGETEHFLEVKVPSTYSVRHCPEHINMTDNGDSPYFFTISKTILRRDGQHFDTKEAAERQILINRVANKASLEAEELDLKKKLECVQFQIKELMSK